MKKIAILLAFIIFAVSTALPVLANVNFEDVSGTEYEEAVFKVSSVGLMHGYDDGMFHPDETMTRAELTTIAVRMSGVISDVPASANSKFTDVTSEHWASGYISMATDMGIIKGFDDGSFRPDNEITHLEALTIIVGALGYEYSAQLAGGYPNGYMTMAGNLHITKGIESDFSLPAKRGEIAAYLSNALEVKPLERDFSDENSYVISSQTLYEKLTRLNDLKKSEGIVTDNGITSLTGESTIKSGLVLIDGVFYNPGQSGAENFLGQKVEIYVDTSKGSSTPVIVSCMLSPDSKEVTVSSDDTEDITKSALSWWNEDGKKKEIDLAGEHLNCIYNGMAVSGSDITNELLHTYNGFYRAVDAEGDGNYETLFINEEESFVVEAVYDRTNTIYFANDELLNGRKGLQLQPDDTDYNYVIKTHDGKKAELGDIKKGMTVTIAASRDEKCVSIVLSSKSVNGTVTAILGEDNKIEIDSAEYEIATSMSGIPKISVRLGDVGTYLMDANGKLMAIGEDLGTSVKYAYIAKSGRTSSGLSQPLMLLAACYGSGTKVVKQQGNTEIISYDYGNSNLLELSCAETVKLDGIKTPSSQIASNSLNGKLISYKLNNEGFVKEISILGSKDDAYDVSFNADVLCFGGRTGIVPFLINETTQVICVPEANAPADDDWLETLTLRDDSDYKCVPVDIDEETQVAGAVAIYGSMDADAPKFFDSDTKVSIVGETSQVLLDDGTVATKIKALTESEIADVVCDDDSSMELIAQKLRKADLIKYELGRDGKINALAYLTSVQGLTDYYNSNAGRANEEIYGLAGYADLGCISAERNEIVDRIVVMLGDDDSAQKRTIDILTEDGPQIYVYERGTGNILPGSSYDILSYDYVGGNASKIFMLINNNEVEVVVIIND